uniref:Uncharacterized protein n=1 Tax=Tanacetum cinerariifolium TaxID=118510 RepID=A0A6L2JEE5_TANCI|nr:hypothetical protein [Tanacetum cinerariifolium]
MTKDPSIPRRNKLNWHYVRDGQMFTMIKLVLRHQNTQQVGVMLPIELTNEEIRNSEAYKEYYPVASRATPQKTKASVRKTKSSSDTSITPPTAAGIRLSTSAKGKQPAKASKPKSLTVLSEVAMTEAEQLKLAIKRSMQQTHISQASNSGADEGTGIIPGVPDVPTEESDEEISWKSSDKDDDDDVDEGSDDQDNDDDQDDDNQDDDDQDEGNDDDQDSDEEGKEFIHPKLSIQNKEKTKEESFDPIAKTPKNSNDDENLGLTIGSKEGQDAEDDEDELYRDVNINLEGRVVQMADVHTTQEFEDIHVTLTPTTSQMDVQAPTTVASLTLSALTLTLSTIATISTVLQAPTPPTTAQSTLLQDLPNFGSLFRFDHRLKTLEANFLEFVQTNQFVGAVSSIHGIVQRYMDQRMNEAVKIIKEQVKEQVKVQVSKILPKIEKFVNDQLEAEVLNRSSNSSETSYAIAADLSEMELKKILIEKIEGNKKGKEPESTSAPKEKATRTTGKSTQGSKSQQKTTSESAPAEEPMQTTQDLEEPSHQEFKTGATDDQPVAEASQHPEWFQKQKKPPTPDRDWNKTLPATYKSIQLWISELAKKADSCSSFNELMDTSVDFLAFLMNQLKVDTLTLELLAGPTYKLMKGSCKSLAELEFFLKEVYKAIIDQDDDKLYKFKEGNFKRLYIQDIEDMLLLMVQGKLTNLTVEERFTFNVSLRMFTRSIVIQRHVKDLQLGVESYQKKLNLTKTDTYHFDLKRKEAYTTYSNPRGFIYQNKDKQNRLMQIDKLHKFSDAALNDV